MAISGTQQRRAALVAYIEGNQQAFYRLAFGYAKNADAAMDIVQEAVVKALSNVHKLRRVETMRTWFYRILVNESLTYLRKNKRFVYDESQMEKLQSKQRDTAQEMDVWQAVQSLPPKLRTVILLRFFEDMKLEEVAQVTQSNLSTVKTRLYKALDVLKRSDLIAQLDPKEGGNAG